jgi:hypothetical protein
MTFTAPRSASRFAFPLVILFVAHADGCSPAPRDPSATEHSALDGDPIADDENLAYVAQNGFGAFVYAVDCVSKKDGEPTQDGEPLTVGDGRWIECTTAATARRATFGILSSASEPWCALGEATSSKGDGDPRLVVTITASPDDGPWTLRADHAGDAIAIARIAGPGGATAWPIWIDATYATKSMKRAIDGASCDDVFAQ